MDNNSSKSLGNTLKKVVGTILAGALGYFAMKWLIESGSVSPLSSSIDKAQKIWLIPGVILLMFVVIAVHELGHLLTGLLQGFSFQLYVVGPLGIKRDPDTDKIVVYFNKELNLAGGLAATTPKSDDPDNINKFARLVIAGPLVSLLFGVILLLLSQNISGIWGVLMGMAGAMSLLIFLVTIFPFGGGGFMSDGKRFLRLLNKKTRVIEIAIMRIMSVYTQTRSYDKLDFNDIQLMKTDESPMLHTMAYYYAYLHFLTVGAPQQAETERLIYMEKAASLPKGMQSFLAKEEERVKGLLENA